MVDFNTALARLLKNGALRDAFAVNPKSALSGMEIGASDREALLRLSVDELEAQADVLLQKRFDQVVHWLPQTCARVGWLGFRAYARMFWPSDELDDALAFTEHLRRTDKAMVLSGEWNRLKFVAERKAWAMHWARHGPKGTPGLQILFRNGPRWKEVFLGARL